MSTAPHTAPTFNRKNPCFARMKRALTLSKPPSPKDTRHFEIDPTGQFLLAANQNSATVVSFRIDSKTGKLTPLGVVIEAETPMCVKCLPPD